MLVTFLRMPAYPAVGIAAKHANKASERTLNRATGVVLVIFGVVILGFNLLA